MGVLSWLGDHFGGSSPPQLPANLGRTNPDGSTDIVNPDGTITHTDKNGQQMVTAPHQNTPFGNIRDALGLGNVPHQPGVAGDTNVPTNPANLVQDPVTGMWYDPTTGRTFTDQSGTTPVTNPNIAQQVAANFQQAQALRALAGQSRAQQNQVFGQQTQLVDNLNTTIHDPNASSVARTQLQQGLGQIANQQLSAAAGVGGQNAFLARRNALNNIANATAKANEASGLARAAEVQGAQNTLAGVLNSQGAGARDMYKTDTGAAGDYSRLALEGQKGQQGMDQAADEATRKNRQTFSMGVIKGLGDEATAGATGGAK